MQRASIRITPRQIALVRESFAKIVPIREAAGVLFYTRLFASDPGTRTLFRGDIKSQGVKLMAAIGTVVKSTASRRCWTISGPLHGVITTTACGKSTMPASAPLCYGRLSKGSVPISRPMCGKPGPQPMNSSAAP